MQLQLLEAIMEVRGLTQSDLARAANVSRQAVSAWFAEANPAGEATIDPKLSVVRQLSASLAIDVNTLISKYPLTRDDQELLRASFIWDGLYPSLISFALALVAGKYPGVG